MFALWQVTCLFVRFALELLPRQAIQQFFRNRSLCVCLKDILGQHNKVRYFVVCEHSNGFENILLVGEIV